MRSFLTILAALSLLAITIVSCADKEKDEPAELLDVNASKLAGKGFKSLTPEVAPGYTEEEAFNALVFVSERHVYWQWSFLDESGVWAMGSYVVRNNVLTIKYPTLYVLNNYEYGTFGGFIDGQSYIERYTIENYDGQYLTLINSNGRTELFKASKAIAPKSDEKKLRSDKDTIPTQTRQTEEPPAHIAA